MNIMTASFVQKTIDLILSQPALWHLKQKVLARDNPNLRNSFNHYFPVIDSEGLNILDVGCGTGSCVYHLFNTEKNFVVGMDLDFGYVRYGSQQHPSIRFINGTANKLPFSRGTFDVIFLSSVIHHLSDQVSTNLFESITTVLHEEGTVLVSEPIWSEDRFSNFLLKNDRGKFVRHRKEYLDLVPPSLVLEKDFDYAYLRTRFLGMCLKLA